MNEKAIDMDNQALAILVGVVLFGALAVGIITMQNPGHDTLRQGPPYAARHDRSTQH
jgi:hypothetical protein